MTELSFGVFCLKISVILSFAVDEMKNLGNMKNWSVVK